MYKVLVHVDTVFSGLDGPKLSGPLCDTLGRMRPLIGLLVLTFLVACQPAVTPEARADAEAPVGARPLEIYFVDVEGGAATLIVTPAGESLLMDTGNQREDGRDANRMYKAAQQAGLKRIDHLLTSHFHGDHWGGVAELHKLIPIGKFYDHGLPSELPEDIEPQLKEAYLRAADGKTETLRPGDEIRLKQASGAARIGLLVLASDGEVIQLKTAKENPECKQAKSKPKDTSDNARSLGFVLTLGKFRFLDLGDLTWNVEHKLACPVNVIGRVDLYQVTHHGLDSSSNPVLLRSVKPQVAVANNGAHKGIYPEVMETLRALPSLEDIYQGHRNLDYGDKQNTAPELIANLGTEEECQGHWIKVAVAPDGESYTITNGRTGQSRKYTGLSPSQKAGKHDRDLTWVALQHFGTGARRWSYGGTRRPRGSDLAGWWRRHGHSRRC